MEDRSDSGCPTVTEEEKRAALHEVIESATLRKHRQLSRFLEYICELEIAGRATEIHEYLIGVEVLEKSEGYSTGEDSAVRNRAHTLRHKLDELYADEMCSAPVRIELPKGSYVPRFTRRQLPVAKARSSAPSSVSLAKSALSRKWTIAAMAFLAGIVAASCILLSAVPGRWRDPTSVPPVVREAWRPLLDPSGHTLLYVATAGQFFVRRLPPDARANLRFEMPDDPEMRRWYFTRYSPLPGTVPYLLPTFSSPTWGEAAGALAAVAVLSASRADYELMPERVSSPFALRDRNAIVLGRPEYSPAAALLLSDTPFGIEYSAAQKCDVIVRRNAPQGAPSSFVDVDDTVRYGLISVLPGLGAGKATRRIVLFSGLTSAGTQAAAEFFSSAERLEELRALWRNSGYLRFPKAYQVIVKARAPDILPMNVDLVTHVLIEK